MCLVSVMSDYGRNNIAPTQWTQPVFNEYQEILKRLAELDAKLNQPDCVDPAKAAWMREVEERLQKLEQT
jgi:tetrahydromethanopterin S-methyltransferase subunit G